MCPFDNEDAHDHPSVDGDGGFVEFIFVFNEPLSILNTVAIYVIYC